MKNLKLIDLELTDPEKDKQTDSQTDKQTNLTRITNKGHLVPLNSGTPTVNYE